MSPTLRSTEVASSSSQTMTATPVSDSRAGHFVADSDGNLVNTAGYYLQGFDLSNGRSIGGCQRAHRTFSGSTSIRPSWKPTQPHKGAISGNLPANAAIEAAPLPSANNRRTQCHQLHVRRPRLLPMTMSAMKCSLISISPRQAPIPGKSPSSTNADSTDGSFPLRHPGHHCAWQHLCQPHVDDHADLRGQWQAIGNIANVLRFPYPGS